MKREKGSEHAEGHMGIGVWNHEFFVVTKENRGNRHTVAISIHGTQRWLYRFTVSRVCAGSWPGFKEEPRYQDWIPKSHLNSGPGNFSFEE